jgi:tRNA pseudouridine55 synthase
MISGALLLDKPLGLSSNAALQTAKRLLGAAKAGHAGTLDPLASGLLLLLFGEATKFAGPLLEADKEYVALLKLGESTATGDAEGAVVARGTVDVPESKIDAALQQFMGTIEQIPPMYSALKQGGVPLYDLARRGETVERRARQVRILQIRATRFEPPFLELQVRCSKGTYIRTLGEDIAVKLGTVAHLAALRRTASGGFRVEDAVSLDALDAADPEARKAMLLPLTSLLNGLPRAELDAAAEARFRNGQALANPTPQEGLCGVYGPDGCVIGLGRADAAGQLHPVRLTASQQAE